MPSAVLVQSARMQPSVSCIRPNALHSTSRNGPFFSILTDDALFVLLSHLSLPSIHVLQSVLPTRVRPLLSSLLRQIEGLDLLRRAEVLYALRQSSSNVPLLSFLLFLPGTAVLPADAFHPLKSIYADAALARSLHPGPVFQLVRAYVAGGGCATGLTDGAHVLSDSSVQLIAAVVDGIRGTALPTIAVALLLRGRIAVVHTLLQAHPWLVVADGLRADCALCKGRHSLLHIAAEIGDLIIVRAIIAAGGVAVLRERDCAGESALAVAVRHGQCTVVQELVRAGAEVRELVGCATRSGMVTADEVWFKHAVDVD